MSEQTTDRKKVDRKAMRPVLEAAFKALREDQKFLGPGAEFTDEQMSAAFEECDKYLIADFVHMTTIGGNVIDLDEKGYKDLGWMNSWYKESPAEYNACRSAGHKARHMNLDPTMHGLHHKYVCDTCRIVWHVDSSG